MSNVKALLAGKGKTELVSVTPNATVMEALTKMKDHNVGAVLVMNGNRLIGIFTERDYARKVELLGTNAKETPVNSVMTPGPEIVCVTPQTTIEECLVRMDMYQIRHLPVFENESLIGVVSNRDVMKGLVKHQIFLAQLYMEGTSGAH